MAEGERRRYPRKVVSTAVTFRDAEGAPLRGWLHDISRGGCFIASPSHLTFGEAVAFDFRLADSHIAGKGRVVWTRDKNERDLPAGMGIAFVDVSEETLAIIDGISGTGARLSRPSTVIGIAPAPATSSPSFSPPPLEPPPESAELASPLAPIEPAPPPKTPFRLDKRWLFAGAGGLVVLAGIVAIVLAFTRGGGSSAEGDGAPADVAAEAETPIEDASAIVVATPDAEPVAMPIVDAAPLDASHDAGRDAGKHGKPRRKIKRHKK